MIPLKSLEELCADKGIQTGPFGSQLKADEYSDDGIPVVMPQDIVDGKIILSDIARITEGKAQNLKRHKLEVGDIIFSRRGDLSKIAVVSENEEGFICGTGCIRARPLADFNPDFLRYYMLTEHVKYWLNTHAVGQTMLNLNTQIVGSLPISSPDKKEQDRVVLTLNKWSSATDFIQLIIQKKVTLYSGVKQDLLSGTRRLQKYKHASKYQKIHGINIPRDWSYPPIEEIASESSIKNNNGDAFPVLSCTKHRGLVDSLSYFGKQIFSKDTSTYKVVARGQFAYATNHIEEGSIGYQNLYDKAVISPMYTVFQTNDAVDDRFLFLTLKTERYRRIFESRTSASVNRRGSLRWKEFSKIHIPLPPMKEQKAIVATLDIFEREIDLLKEKLETLKRQKQGLMQQLLTGKIQLKKNRK